jgi:hypothetical protein
MDTGKVVIELTRAEALVLFDLLARWSERGGSDLHLEHQAEQRVLWDVEAMLESGLADTLLPDYQDRLIEARQRVEDRDS